MELLGNNPSMQDLIEKLNEVVGSLNNSLPNTDSEIAEVKKLVSFGSGVLAGRLNAKLWYFKTQELMTASTELCEGDSCFVLKDGVTTGEGTFEYWYIYKTSDVVDIIDSYVDLSNPDLVAVKLQDMTLKDVKDTLSAQISDQSKDLNTKISNLRTDTETALSGKADLVNGLIPASQLPFYVDDIVESWLEDIEFPENAYAKEDTEMTTPLTPEFSKIYVNLLNNKTYRWGGNFYVEVSKSLAIGETATTAFAGDRGKTLETKVANLSVFVTPQMFGAVGDGVTNDSEAFRRAVQSGFNVYVPKGTYCIKEVYATLENTVIFGDGNAKLKATSDAVTKNCILTLQAKGCSVYGLTFIGNISVGGSEDGIHMLDIMNTSHCNVHDCNFYDNAYVAVRIYNSSHCNVHDIIAKATEVAVETLGGSCSFNSIYNIYSYAMHDDVYNYAGEPVALYAVDDSDNSVNNVYGYDKHVATVVIGRADGACTRANVNNIHAVNGRSGFEAINASHFHVDNVTNVIMDNEQSDLLRINGCEDFTITGLKGENLNYRIANISDCNTFEIIFDYIANSTFSSNAVEATNSSGTIELKRTIGCGQINFLVPGCSILNLINAIYVFSASVLIGTASYVGNDVLTSSKAIGTVKNSYLNTFDLFRGETVIINPNSLSDISNLNSLYHAKTYAHCQIVIIPNTDLTFTPSNSDTVMWDDTSDIIFKANNKTILDVACINGVDYITRM